MKSLWDPILRTQYNLQITHKTDVNYYSRTLKIQVGAKHLKIDPKCACRAKMMSRLCLLRIQIYWKTCKTRNISFSVEFGTMFSFTKFFIFFFHDYFKKKIF